MAENIETSGVRECIERLRRNLHDAAHPIRPPAAREKKSAAVLIPLFEREDGLHVLYTRRSDRLISHRGQVAFPGGRYDRSDPDLLATALREAYEEVGIRPESVDVLGSFRGRLTNSTNILVAPFVGVVRGSPLLRADPAEVAEMFHVPLSVLRDPGYRGTYQFGRDGQLNQRPAIFYHGQVIWGLTFELTEKFLEFIEPRDSTTTPPANHRATH